MSGWSISWTASAYQTDDKGAPTCAPFVGHGKTPEEAWKALLDQVETDAERKMQEAASAQEIAVRVRAEIEALR